MRLKITEWNGLLMAVFFFESMICQMLDAVVSIENISVFLMATVCILFLTTNRNLQLGKMRRIGGFLIAVYSVLLVSMFLNGVANVVVPMQYFTVFGITALVLVSGKYDIPFFFRSCYAISLAYLAFHFIYYRGRMSELSSSEYYSMAQSIGYVFAIILFLHLIYLKYFMGRRVQLMKKVLSCAAIALSAYGILFDARSRGALVSLAIYVWALIFINVRNKSRMVGFAVVGCVAILLLLNLESVLIFLSELLNAMGLHVNAVEKSVYFLRGGMGIDNGRSEIFKMSWELIRKSPLVGSGVGALQKYYGVEYPHNILLQLLYEIGIIGTVIVVVFLMRGVISNFLRIKTHPDFGNAVFQNQIFEYFIFLSTVGYLLFSLSYWRYQPFWLYVAITLTNYDRRKVKQVYERKRMGLQMPDSASLYTGNGGLN